MANNFTIGGLDLESAYITDQTVIDNYVTTGTIWTWGNNAQNMLGDGSTSRSSPVQISVGNNNWKQTTVSTDLVGALKTDGTIWMWGVNSYGGIGVGGTNNAIYSTPVQVGTLSNWKSIVCGQYWTMALRQNGTLWTWGYNTSGQLGNNSVTQTSTPIQVGSLNLWTQIATGTFHALALQSDGTLWTWGANSVGQLGDNTRTPRSSPIQVSAGTTWKTLMYGYNGTTRSAAIRTDGTLWLWGNNTTGSLGVNDGTTASFSTPQQIYGGGTNWRQINTSLTNHCIALKDDGTLWTWGSNNNGQLGDFTTNITSSPIQTVFGGSNWKQVFTGGNLSYPMSLAIKTDGTLWSWGAGGPNGQSGRNDQNKTSSPIQIGALTSWKQIVSASVSSAIYFYN